MSAKDSTILKIHNDLKVLLSGCKHISDANDILYMYKDKYPKYENIITSIVNGKVYENSMSIKNIHSIITDISLLTYKEDVIELIDNICEGRIISDPQKRSFLRLGKMKIIKPFTTSIEDKPREKIELDKKKCPHCGNLCVAPKNTEYIICGYNDPHKGYDFRGCGRDWCFKCGKMLCKVWEHDTLFLEMNRQHNGDCCAAHAKKHNKKYLSDYCQCINHHVNRNNMPFDFGISLT